MNHTTTHWRIAKNGYNGNAVLSDGNIIAFPFETNQKPHFDRVLVEESLPDNFIKVQITSTVHQTYNIPHVLTNQKVWLFSSKGMNTYEFKKACQLI